MMVRPPFSGYDKTGRLPAVEMEETLCQAEAEVGARLQPSAFNLLRATFLCAQIKFTSCSRKISTLYMRVLIFLFTFLRRRCTITLEKKKGRVWLVETAILAEGGIHHEF